MSLASRNKNLQLFTSKQLIARIFNDFGITNNTLAGSIYEYIGDAVQGIGYGANFEVNSTKLCVKDHKANYPCGIISIIGVLYNNERLPIGSDISQYGIIDWNKTRGSNVVSSNIDADNRALTNAVNLLDDKQTEYDDYLVNGGSPSSPYAVDLLEQIKELQNKIKSLSLAINISVSKKINSSGIINNYYDAAKDFLITSFPEGEVILVYSSSPVDDDGFPLLIDSFKYKEAVTWYCIYRMILRGYEHKSIKDFGVAMQLWEKYRIQAINESKKFSQDDMEKFKNMWASAKPNAESWNNFFIHGEQFNGGQYR